MTVETYQKMIFLVMCLVMSAYIMYRMRHYIKAFFGDRKEGETFVEFICRAGVAAKAEEHAECDRNMQRFGGQKKYALISLVNLLGLCFVVLSVAQGLLLPTLYWLLGISATFYLKLLPAEKLEGLSFSDRIWLRTYHSWFLPMYLWHFITRGSGN